jgi:tRNA pseudouridine55 synthase
MSSNAALQRVRSLLGRPKAGHTGSLDPLATGMLPICLGEATKLAGALLAGAKGYTVEMRLGERTDTGDAEGQVIERLAVPPLDRALIEAALAVHRGPQLQVPPMHSALKRDGQPLYKLARQGISVERAPREIVISVLELLDFNAGTLRARVECSKGTYIRVLAEQIGSALGSVAHVTSLRRDFVEPFRDVPMHTLEQLEGMAGDLPLLEADLAVGHLPLLRLSAGQSRAISFGQAIEAVGAPLGELRLYDASGRFLGLAQGLAGGKVSPARLFAAAIARCRN